MANASFLARFFSEFTPTTWSVIVAICGGAVVLVKVWPLIKGKINEARKIQLDADAELRGDLLDRIRDLENSRDGEPIRLAAALATEQARCDAELARRDAAFSEYRIRTDQRIDGLVRTIAQNSRSRAHLIGDADKLGDKAVRKEPKK